MAHQPLANLGMLMGGVVVGDGMDELAGRHGPLDRIEEADELLMAMLLHAPADDLAVQYVQGGKQRGRAVPDVVVCHGAAAALLHRQTRLSAIERLYLALFIDRENDSVRRRVHIEPDDVSQLGGKLRVVGQLEQARPVRPQTMSAPDALHRTDADTLEPGHGGGRLVRGLSRRINLGRGDDARRNIGFERRNARRPGLVAQQASDTVRHEAFLPAPDNSLADTGLPHDLGRAATVRCQQHDLSSLAMLLRAVSVRHDRIQLDTIRRTHVDFDTGAHPADSHVSTIAGIRIRTQMSDFIH